MCFQKEGRRRYRGLSRLLDPGHILERLTTASPILMPSVMDLVLEYAFRFHVRLSQPPRTYGPAATASIITLLATIQSQQDSKMTQAVRFIPARPTWLDRFLNSCCLTRRRSPHLVATGRTRSLHFGTALPACVVSVVRS